MLIPAWLWSVCTLDTLTAESYWRTSSIRALLYIDGIEAEIDNGYFSAF